MDYFEYQDLLADLNATASNALECLQKNDLDGCGRWIKALLDEIRENMDTYDDG